MPVKFRAHTASLAEQTADVHPLAANWRSQVVLDPARPGEDRARVLPSGYAVWALIAYLQALAPEFTADSIAKTATDYDIPIESVTAAIAYYDEHREAIDARLASNEAAVA